LRVGGNRTLYVKLVRQFIEQQANTPSQIAAHLAAGDVVTAERLAHTVKGVAGNLGAGPVQAAAAELERAIGRRAEPSDLEAWREQLARVLTELVAGVCAALGSPPAPAAMAAEPPSVDPQQVPIAVGEMLRCLTEFDAAAVDCLAVHRAAFQNLFSAEGFGNFERLIEGYAFEEARIELERVGATHIISSRRLRSDLPGEPSP
jgi:two-component system sensor histidine kinase/response regulator